MGPEKLKRYPFWVPFSLEAEVTRLFQSLLVQNLTQSISQDQPSFRNLSHEDPVFQALRHFATSTLVQHRSSYNSDEWSSPAKLCNFCIERLHNQMLLQRYQSEIHDLAILRGRVPPISDLQPDGSSIPFFELELMDASLNEVLLFHGAPPDVLAQITLAGFDPLRAGERAGAMFGSSYFARNLSKCDFYASRGTRRQVLLSRVLGHPHQAVGITGWGPRRPLG